MQSKLEVMRDKARAAAQRAHVASLSSFDKFPTVSLPKLKSLAPLAIRAHNYFTDPRFEEKIDILLLALSTGHDCKQADFSSLSGRHERLIAKFKEISVRSGTWIVSAGAVGSQLGTYLGQAEMGMVIGTTVGFILIVFIMGVTLIFPLSDSEADHLNSVSLA